ncbi:MAG: acetyltransferase [Phycisphaerales bacterium]|nr:MAG: acetyltransferase [Phycisphaerales bacterium]
MNTVGKQTDPAGARKPLAIWGAKGPALIVAEIIRLRGEYDVVGYLDNLNPDRRGTGFGGARVLGGEEELGNLWESGVRHIAFAFQNNHARLRLAKMVKAKGFELATAIHPTACVSASARIGAGTVVRAQSAIGPETQIGENCIIGYGAMISHNCLIGDGAHLSSGVNVAGSVKIGRATWVGIGATIIDPKSVGDDCVVGAGAVVTNDVPDGVVAYGVPARVVRANDRASVEST